jgi:hypothetical protein
MQTVVVAEQAVTEVMATEPMAVTVVLVVQ